MRSSIYSRPILILTALVLLRCFDVVAPIALLLGFTLEPITGKSPLNPYGFKIKQPSNAIISLPLFLNQNNRTPF